MARDASGNWIPLAPVVGGTVITSTWANNMMTSFGADVTESLDRSGRGGMLVPFRIADGNKLEPGYSWTAELSTGFYRDLGGFDMRTSVGGKDIFRWNANGAQISYDDGVTWNAVVTEGGGGGQTGVDIGTVQGQTLRWDEDTTKTWIPSSALIVDDAGNVGIGTAAPLTPLVVSAAGAEGIELLPQVAVGVNLIQSYDRALDDYVETRYTGEAHEFWAGLSPPSLAMRITDIGFVGIGTKTPDKLLEVRGVGDGTDGPAIRVRNNFNGTYVDNGRVAAIEFYSADGSSPGPGIKSSIASISEGTFGGRTALTLSVSGTANNVEAMRINSNGLVGLNQNTPTAALEIKGTGTLKSDPAQILLYNSTGTFTETSAGIGFSSSLGLAFRADLAQWVGIDETALVFKQGGTDIATATELMRLDNVGNLLVNKTTDQGATDGVIQAFPANSSTRCALTAFGPTGTTTGMAFIRFRLNNGTASGLIQSQGANSAAFAAFSDVRLKKNVTDYTGALAEINALRPVRFNWIEGGEAGIGFIAQEVETVYPENVGQDGEYKTVGDMSATTARLIAAIQELTARVEALGG